MDIFIVAFAGLVLGSFTSVLVGRWPSHEGVVGGRSRCPHCMHTLAWYDLIPLVSWLTLRGRCRYCRGPISWWYPVYEATMAAVLTLFALRFGVASSWFLVDLIILAGFVALFFFDLRHQVLPDMVTYPLGVIIVLRLIMLRPDLLVNSLATGAVLAGLLGALYAGSRGRLIGFGDVKLAFVIGAYFGFPGAVGVTLAAIWLGALVGVGLMVLRRASMQTALPFGSFWVAVAILTMLWPSPVFFLSGLVLPPLP